MRKLIKNLIIGTFVIIGITTESIAQVTKSDFDIAFRMMETTSDSISKIYIQNINHFYSDASADLHMITMLEDEHPISLLITESGVLIEWGSIKFIPFTSIKWFKVYKYGIDITLID